MSGKRGVIVLFLLLLLIPLVNAIRQEDVNIALYHLTPKQELCRCEDFNYNLVVYNTGSLNETYSFGVSRYAHSFNISPSTVFLKPRETAIVGIGARLPCSVTKPGIDFIAKTKTTGLKAKTPLQLSINSSCYAPDINMTQVRVFPRQAEVLSALLFILLLVVAVLLFLLILKQRRKEYWWSPYFRLRPERKVTIIEIVTIVIVVILLVVIGFKGFQQIGRNESLITTYLGPKNETLPVKNVTPDVTTSITTNVTQIAPEKAEGIVAKGLRFLGGLMGFLWSHKLYVLLGLFLLLLLILLIIMSFMFMRKRRERPARTARIRKPRRIKLRYMIIPLVLLILLALVVASLFLVFKYRYRILAFLSAIISKLRLDKVKDFLLPKLLALLGFFKWAFDLVRPYIIYVIIGLVLLAIIILLLRRREKANARVITVKEARPEKALKPKKKPRKKRKKTTKKKKR
jgi:heme/copper-type cytochrome/quinol oxidase subunit 2